MVNISEYLQNKKPCQSSKLKKLLIEHGIFENKCQCCGISGWMDKPLVFHLHHIDGNNLNNKLTNLLLLCPNCHSQTDNYTGRNKKRKSRIFVSDETMVECVKTSYNRRQALLKCGLAGYGGSYKRINEVIKKHAIKFLDKPISTERKRYLEKRLISIEQKYGSYQEAFKKKIDWPSKEKLEELLKVNSCAKVAVALRVSSSSVRKQLKRYGLDIKQISPWAVKHGC